MYLQICVPTKGVLIVKSTAISTCQSGISESNGVAHVSDKKREIKGKESQILILVMVLKCMTSSVLSLAQSSIHA